MPAVRPPAPAGLTSLRTDDFERFWEAHVGFVRGLARRTLRRFGPKRALERVQRGAPASSLPSAAAVRESLRDSVWLADDVVQDVALAVWEHLAAGKFLGTTAEDARRFLCTLTVRSAPRAAYRAATAAFAAGDPVDDEGPELEALDRGASAELACTVAQVLELLPGPERSALVAGAEGYTHEDVAATLGRTVEASRALRYRAARAAAELLAAA